MKIGRVVGTVVSTVNAPAFDGRTLLLCDLLDPAGTLAGGYVIAVDSVGAGAGETVLILDEGNSARQVLVAAGAPIRTVVVGIVDAVVEAASTDAPGEAQAILTNAAAGPVRATHGATGRPARPARPAPRR